MANIDDATGESKEKHRRGYASIKAIDPRDGGKWDVLIADAKMDHVAKRGEGAARELAFTVRWALFSPCAIFRGVRDEDENDWLCYVARPDHAYDLRTGERRKAWDGEVILVFVTEERVVYNWYWVPCDQFNQNLPHDYEDRFTERLL